MERLGLDLGGVLIAEVFGMSWLPLSLPHFRKMLPVEGAREAIPQLASLFKDGGIHIVSQCCMLHQSRAEAWLRHTGIRPHIVAVHFCLHWREKAAICEREGITHFVDNKPHILQSLTQVSHRHLFRSWPEVLRAFA